MNNKNTTPVNKTEINTAKAIGAVFAAISTYCSALLWWSFAEGLLDQIITATLGAGFVVAQYLFFSKRKEHIAFFATAIILLAISTIATMGFIESRLNSINDSDVKNSDRYNQLTKKIEQLNTTLSLQNASAEKDLTNKEENYTGRANKTLKAAQSTEAAITEAEAERSALIKESPRSDKSGSAIANILGDWRWLLWLFLALMVDLIVVLCVAIVKKGQQKNVAKFRHLRSDEIKKIVLKGTPSVLPKPFKTLSKHDALTATIANKIISNTYGDMPSQQAVMRDFKIRHARAKAIFQELQEMQVIEWTGTRFKRLNNLFTQPNQEQPA